MSRPIPFVLFLIGGLAIFLFGNNLNDLFPTNTSTLYKAALPIVFLVLAVVLYRSSQLKMYRRIALALFIVAFANWLNWTLGNWLPRFVGPLTTTAQELTIDKLAQCIPVVLVIIVLRANAPASRGMTASGVSLNVIITALPWMLAWAFANSLMEELWFRGIFLKQLNPFLGATAAGVATSLVFSLLRLASLNRRGRRSGLLLAPDCACAAGDPAVTGLTLEVERMADAIVESIEVTQ